MFRVRLPMQYPIMKVQSTQLSTHYVVKSSHSMVDNAPIARNIPQSIMYGVQQMGEKAPEWKLKQIHQQHNNRFLSLPCIEMSTVKGGSSR